MSRTVRSIRERSRCAEFSVGLDLSGVGGPEESLSHHTAGAQGNLHSDCICSSGVLIPLFTPASVSDQSNQWTAAVRESDLPWGHMFLMFLNVLGAES